MVAKHTGDAKDEGADAMETPCPLCHLNLDGYQAKARRQNKRGKADLPILHLPHLIGMAMGLDRKELGIYKHLVSTAAFIKSIKTKVA